MTCLDNRICWITRLTRRKNPITRIILPMISNLILCMGIYLVENSPQSILVCEKYLQKHDLSLGNCVINIRGKIRLNKQSGEIKNEGNDRYMLVMITRVVVKSLPT